MRCTGKGPGEFNTVHSVFIDDADDTLYAADRFNNRVQSFTLDGQYLGEGAACGCRRRPQGPRWCFLHRRAGPLDRVTVLDRDGTVLARWGDGVEVDDFETGGVALALPDAPSRDPMVKGRVRNEPGAGLFGAPHGIAVNSEGSFYVADTSEAYIGLDRGSRSIQKFVRR